MYRIIYLSSATTKFSNDEIMSLLESSRKNNEINEITGLLLYSDGNFLQILEGNKKPLDDLYKKISIDSRHKNIIKVFHGKVPERNYSNWKMGFSTADKSFYKKNITNLNPFTLEDNLVKQDLVASIFIETFLKSSKDKILIKK